jgi:hypothetical protein
MKERLLLMLGSLGKATVQATVGPTAYQDALAQYQAMGSPSSYLPVLNTTNQIRLVATLFILIFAPIGAASLLKLGVHVLPLKKNS